MDRKKKIDNDKISISSFFASPVMKVQLDLDLEKLTKLTFQMKKNKTGEQKTNRGGWHSALISFNKAHEEFIRLKDEIDQYLQIYHAEVFRGMKFKENIIMSTTGMWVNINGKNHYNEWHTHPYATVSGSYYIKHDGSRENGNIMFKHPIQHMSILHWPEGMIEEANETTSAVLHVTPKPNMLLLFPSWLEHKVEINEKNDSRISLSFNAQPMLKEK